MYSTYTSFKVLRFSKAVLADITFKFWEDKGRVKTPWKGLEKSFNHILLVSFTKCDSSLWQQHN